MKEKGERMKTVKEVSELTGISIRTLRYYDEIDLLKPAKVTEAGYRLYDESSLKILRQIMFFREMEVPLSEIKVIMKDSESDNRKILETQKMMLEMKRNRLNGIIELISDVLKGEDKMSFETFNKDDIQKIIQHSLKIMSEEDVDQHIIIWHFRRIKLCRNNAGIFHPRTPGILVITVIEKIITVITRLKMGCFNFPNSANYSIK